jgi:hypothetical protein
VVTLLAIRVNRLAGLNFCSRMNSTTHATNEARNPTIMD